MGLLSLPPGRRYHRARRVSQPQLAGARVAQPHDDVRRIRPEERADLTRNLHSLIDPESLQSLNIKNAIIKITVGAPVSMNTLPLAIRLSRHDDSPYSSRRRSAKTEP